MNRRAFFRRFGGVVAAVAVAQGVVRKVAGLISEPAPVVFNPVDYQGDWLIRSEVFKTVEWKASPWVNIVRKSDVKG